MSYHIIYHIISYHIVPYYIILYYIEVCFHNKINKCREMYSENLDSFSLLTKY